MIDNDYNRIRVYYNLIGLYHKSKNIMTSLTVELKTKNLLRYFSKEKSKYQIKPKLAFSQIRNIIDKIVYLAFDLIKLSIINDKLKK